MYKVYWTERTEVMNFHEDCSEEFEADQLLNALTFMESLRKDRRDGRAVSFITMVAENPDSVGQAGVDVTGPEYKNQWYKRRPAPTE